MSARTCGCDPEAFYVSAQCARLGYCLMLAETTFGGPTPAENVRASELVAADRREADEREQRREACEGCGRVWLHSLASGHGDKARRQTDGRFWHESCWTRRPR